ncbi:unnamed protein product, partial [Polarella glacialis]
VRLSLPRPRHEVELLVAQDPSLAHGGLLWTSGIVLAQYLATSGFDCLGPSTPRAPLGVLELGCGAAALPSLAAAASLGARVTATDFGEIVPLLSDSVRRNSAALRLDPGAHVDVASYAWSESQAPPGSPYDLVLAADLLYDESCQVALVSAILAALGSDSGTLLMTYEERDARVEARFFGLLKEKSSATSIPLALPPPAVSGPTSDYSKQRLVKVIFGGLQPAEEPTLAADEGLYL